MKNFLINGNKKNKKNLENLWLLANYQKAEGKCSKNLLHNAEAKSEIPWKDCQCN